jgi:hypothetical protein
LKDNYPDPTLSPAPEESFKRGQSGLDAPVSGYGDGIAANYMRILYQVEITTV